jgi:hypothetical protein
MLYFLEDLFMQRLERILICTTKNSIHSSQSPELFICLVKLCPCSSSSRRSKYCLISCLSCLFLVQNDKSRLFQWTIYFAHALRTLLASPGLHPRFNPDAGSALVCAQEPAWEHVFDLGT